MMTLDEAIKHCLEVAGEQQKRADSAELIDILDGLDVEACKECAADHRQLAVWLQELKEAKRLLKLAVDDANSEAESLCAFCKHNHIVDGCPYIESYSECEYIWRYTDEALKLIGGSENG